MNSIMKNVKSIYIKELHYYSPEELVKILDINLDLLMDVLPPKKKFKPRR